MSTPGLTPVAGAAIGQQAAVPLAAGGIGQSTTPFLSLSSGTFVLNGTTAQTVTNSLVTANSVILVGLNTVGGTVGALPAVKTVTPGTGFTVAGTAADTSTYNYVILG